MQFVTCTESDNNNYSKVSRFAKLQFSPSAVFAGSCNLSMT